MAGWLTDGVVGVGTPTLNYPQILGYEQANFDTMLPGGAQPQTVAASAFEIAALYLAISNATAAATAGAATLNAPIGTITSEALTTAAGATYTLTLTNSVVTATSNVQAACYAKTSTTGGPMALVSATPSAGAVVLVFKNAGSAVLNGTLGIMFQVANAK